MTKQAIDIERLVEWAFRTQKVEAEVGRVAVGPAGWPRVSSMAIERVDGGGPDVWPAVHDDALVVLAAVEALEPVARMLVKRHGAAGTRPDWVPRPEIQARPVERWTSQGWRPVVVYADQPVCRRPLYCPIRYEGDVPDLVDERRRQYECWHGALVVLAGHFRSRPWLLREWRVVGPAAPARPWCEKSG